MSYAVWIALAVVVLAVAPAILRKGKSGDGGSDSGGSISDSSDSDCSDGGDCGGD